MLLSRRSLLGAGALGAAAVTGFTSPSAVATFPLYQDSIRLVGGTVRDVRGPRPRQPAAERWVGSGSVPAVAELGPTTMFHDALADLHTLSAPHGVPVAGWAGPWRYVWPRDSAPVAVALAWTGHRRAAERILAFLERVQPASGHFQARYRPDGSGPPDGRGVQLDGTGWALWALRAVAEADDDPVAMLLEHRILLDRSAAALLTMVDTPTGLPPASPDYWEVPERATTLSTAALTLAGLRAGASAYERIGLPRTELSDAAVRLSAVIGNRFGGYGFPRHAGGRAGSVDLGVAFLLPPLAPGPKGAAHAAWLGSAERMRRPAGGLSPGGSWPDDGVSWTVSTSWHAVTAAACGDREVAVSWLRWLDRHRTPAGSLPEKVLYDGSPASVAPLAWTAAAVLLAACLLADA